MLLEKAKDPAFWELVRTSVEYKPFCDELLGIWEKECGISVPACSYSDFSMFAKTGSRTEYEKPYFLRRRQMNVSAILSLIYPDEETYINYLIEVIWAILDEYVWVLPAHMPSMSEVCVDYIDLFSSETGFALSEIDYVLGERLPPLVRDRIRRETEQRIIKPFLEKTFHWESISNNWSAVCLCGVIGTILYSKPELIEGLMPRMESVIGTFLSGFSEEGMCLEGFGYWNYGFGFFTVLADLMYEYTGGKTDWFKDERVRKIAGYAQKMFLCDNVTVSFADSAVSSTYHIGLLHYLKEKYPEDVTVPDRKYSYTNDSCGRWCTHFRAILWFDKSIADAEQDRNRTEFMEHAGWLIKTTPEYGFAAKGGNNAEHHNHNDLASFIIARNGKQILTDPGSGVYTREYFSAERYRDFCASSRGHCVPIINGCCQIPGEKASASSVFEDGVFTVEFSKGYDIPSLTSLVRKFSFDDGVIRMRDQYDYDGVPQSFTERFVTTFEPGFEGNVITVGSLRMCADMSAVEKIAVNEEDYRGKKYYCIDYELRTDAREFDLTIELS